MRKPPIAIYDTDYELLSTLATNAMDRMPIVAGELLEELQRANVETDKTALFGTVRMGSTVDYQSTDGRRRVVKLVYPADANIADGKISVLTPIGTALLGLTVGQTIGWTTNDARQLQLSVVGVLQEEEAS